MQKQELKQQTITALKKNFELEGDGHTMFNPEYYTKMGLPKELVDKNIKVHKSDGSWKGSFWKDEGKALVVMAEIRSLPKNKSIPDKLSKRFAEVYQPELKGVYNLDFLYSVCEVLEIKTDNPFIGRGFQAQHLVEKIKAFINTQ